MKSQTRFIKLVIITLLAYTAVVAQTPVDAKLISSKIDLFAKAQSSGVLYAHFDKTIYTNNEDVWFTAYLLNSTSPAKHTTLSVALVNDNDRHIAQQELFTINAGMSYGHLVLPDTIAPGFYHLLVYTNVLDRQGKPVDVFSQPITIKTTREAPFSASAKLLDTVPDANGNLKAIVKVESAVITKKNTPTVRFSSAKIAGAGQTNYAGEYIITIPRNSGDLLRIAVKQADDEQFISVRLPVERLTPVIRFYPEGGNLAAGKNNLVGWEAKLTTGEPLKIAAVLYKDGRVLDTVETNYYGIGKFNLTPDKTSIYTLVPIKSTRLPDKADSIYKLPPALPNIPSLHIFNALAEDTLTLQVRGNKPQTVTVLVHNFKEIAAYQDVNISSKTTTIKILLNNSPKGLNTVTLMDSLGRPLAERIFFAHYRQHNTLSISTDKTSYDARTKVTLKLKLNNDQVIPASGVFSVACVQDNRIESNQQIDIATYLYLKHDLQSLPPDPTGENYNNREYVSDILLIKGWRKYKWTDVLLLNNADSTYVDSSARFWGRVTIGKRLLKKPLTITLNGPAGISAFDTGKQGSFELLQEQLLTTPGRKISLMAAGKFSDIYTINIINPYDLLNLSLSKDMAFERPRPPLEASTKTQKISGLEKTIALKEVVIRDTRDGSLYGMNGSFKRVACPDYICIYGILNCRNHVNDYHSKPEYGRVYSGYTYGVFTGDRRYTGCTVFIEENLAYKQKLNGINLPKEYYPIDEALINTTEPEFLSTIYWNYSVPVEADKEVTLSFYTGDITGRSRVVVQGATATEVISKQLFFNVKKK